MAPQHVSRRPLAGGAVVAAAALLSVLAAPEVPERMTTYWNAAGVPDGEDGANGGDVLAEGPE